MDKQYRWRIHRWVCITSGSSIHFSQSCVILPNQAKFTFISANNVLIGVILNCTFYDNKTSKWYSMPVHDPVPADCSLPDFISHREPGAFVSNLSVNAQGCHYSHQMSPLWPLNSYQLGFYILQSTSSFSPEHDTVMVLLVKLTVLRSANRLWCHHQNNMCLSELVCWL